MRRGRRRFRVLQVVECRRGVAFRRLRRQFRPRVFVRFEMAFRTLDRQLCGLKFGGSGGGGARRFRGGDGLAGIAHFLHGRTGHATEERGDSDQYEHVPQHKDGGH